MKSGPVSPATRIVVAAVGMLAATSIIVGVAVMAVMKNRIETEVSELLSARLESRSHLFVALVELRESQMLFISTRPGLKHSLRKIASGHDVEHEIASVQSVLQSFVDAGFTGLAYEDGNGRELTRAGRFSEKTLLKVKLGTALESELEWSSHFILVARIALDDGEGPLGTVIAEQPLPIATQLMQADGNLGKTGETALCFAKGEGMRCFPQRLNPSAFDLPLYGQDGKALPMTHALWGETGLIAALDYRNQQVIAAYGPMGLLGLGMVVKMDAAELLAPAREQLLTILAACALLVAGAALLMQRLMRPMLQRMVHAEKEARDMHVRLNFALDASRVTVWDTDVGTGETVLSEAWAELLERPSGETRTTVAELAALVHPSELAELRRLQMAAVSGKSESYSVEHRVRAASGHWKWILSRGQVIERDRKGGRALRMMGTNLDITERKNSEIGFETLANYDTLTGAANRALFVDRVQRAVARNRRSSGHAALMYLDIDKFKGVNDTYGHAAGDALLKEFAARLAGCVRATDTVARLGGDEFAVLLEDLTETNAVRRIADKILAAMRQPMSVDGRDVTVSVSIGMVVFGDQPVDEPAVLAKRADAALYEAKAAGRNTYRMAA